MGSIIYVGSSGSAWFHLHTSVVRLCVFHWYEKVMAHEENDWSCIALCSYGSSHPCSLNVWSIKYDVLIVVKDDFSTEWVVHDTQSYCRMSLFWPIKINPVAGMMSCWYSVRYQSSLLILQSFGVWSVDASIFRLLIHRHPTLRLVNDHGPLIIKMVSGWYCFMRATNVEENECSTSWRLICWDQWGPINWIWSDQRWISIIGRDSTIKRVWW